LNYSCRFKTYFYDISRALRDVNFTIKATINLSQATRLSVDFITYFEVIQTKTYTSHVPTWSKSISDKIAPKKASNSFKKSSFWTSKQLFAIHFLLATCNVCPVAIPEPFAHNRGIRLVANHSLKTEKFFHMTKDLLLCAPHRAKK